MKSSARSGDLVSGTWKLNLRTSKFAGLAAPKSLTVVLEVSGDQEKSTTEGVSGTGRRIFSQHLAKYNSQDYPIGGSTPDHTIALRRIDALTSERVDKRGGIVVETRTRKLSPDGKSLTVTVGAAQPGAQPIKHILVFDKQ